jgi:Ca-activated chloride channel family protein
MTFQAPLALLLFFPLAVMLLLRRKRPAPAIPFPGVAHLYPLPKTLRQRLARLIPRLQVVALICLIIALARPQLTKTENRVTSRGVDIVIALDLSTSMLAVDRDTTDRSRSRLAIAREVTRDFIARRPGDRIGFVAFAARPYPIAPLTLDHDWLTAVLDRLEIGSIEDGTALGDGILSAVNRLRSSPAGSRTVVVLTDGRSNGGVNSPRIAALAAQALGIRVHTVGIGANAPALFPVENPLGGVIWRKVNADLDEAALQEIAGVTGGTYFRADKAATLRSVFQEIDRLEKRPIEEKRSRSVQELYPPLVLVALILLLFAQTLRNTWLRGLPL